MRGPGHRVLPRAGVPWPEWDCRVLAGLGRLRASVGRSASASRASRSSGRGRPAVAAAGVDPEAWRLSRSRSRRRTGSPGSLAATAAAVLAGAHLIRAHDVAETVQAVRVAEAIRRAGEERR